MMRLLFLLLFPMKLLAFSDQGVVTIRFSYGESHAVKIYKSSTGVLPFCICHSDEQLDSLLPSYYMYSGTATISYCCAEETKERYCIRNATPPFVLYWMEKDTFTEFHSWESWWTSWGATTVGSNDTIRQKPYDHASLLKKECECNIVTVDSLSGEWMKIIFDAYCGNDTQACPLEKPYPSYWIRWKRGDTILASPYIAE